MQCAVETTEKEMRRAERNGRLAETGERLRLPPCLWEWWRVFLIVALFEVAGMRPFPSPAAPSHLGIFALSAALRTLPAQQGTTPSTSQHPTPRILEEKKTHWHVLSWRSPSRGRHWIFRRRQKRHASLALNTGRLRPNKGKVKADSSALLPSFMDAAGAPVEDEGREDSDESGLDAAE